jgi:hypothetical protein
MDVTIRRAVKEDCPRLLALVQELATYTPKPPKGGFTTVIIT